MIENKTIYLKSNFLYGENFKFKKGILVIEDNIIKGFTTEQIKNPLKYNGIVIPPLINCHTHIGDCAIKDIGINKTLDQLVKPPNGLKHKFLNSCDDNTLIYGMVDGLRELKNNGIKYFCDFRENGVKGIELLKKAINICNTNEKNNKYNKYNIINPIILGRPTIKLKNDENKLKTEINNILSLANGIGLSGCNEYDDKELKFIKKCIEANKNRNRNKNNNNDNNNNNILFSIHANEHKDSVQYSLNHYNKTEIERIINLKLNPNFIIHGNYLSSHEIDLLKENNISVVVCPRANASFNVGLPDINTMLKEEILIGVGTDNFMANSPSIFKEMDFIYKLYHIEPVEILKFATINNSRILKLNNVGLINEGYYPQFTFIKPDVLNINYTKNIVASIITRCEKGDIDSDFKLVN